MKKLLSLPLAAPPPRALKACTECGKCCTYVSVGINPPNSLRRVSDMLWYLYHENVAIYRDGSGEWSVVFETRCRNLQDDLLCGVYEQRPIICRDFDNTTCEVNDPEGSLNIRSPQELLAFLKVKRPGLHRKLLAKYVPGSLREGAR